MHLALFPFSCRYYCIKQGPVENQVTLKLGDLTESLLETIYKGVGRV